MSTIAHIMRKNLKSIAHTASVRNAAKRMKTDRLGSLLIKKKGKFVGIVTDTDVVRRAVASGKDLNKMMVEAIMTNPITTIESTRTAHDAHDMMGDLGIRHLGVTEGGKIVGMVSVRDLLVFYQRVSEPKITQD
ncbi:MAG: CBS domain-containing protein [Nitrospiraceae bacterium]